MTAIQLQQETSGPPDHPAGMTEARSRHLAVPGALLVLGVVGGVDYVTGHELLALVSDGGEIRFWIRKHDPA